MTGRLNRPAFPKKIGPPKTYLAPDMNKLLPTGCGRRSKSAGARQNASTGNSIEL
jgi:hypothetical protein